jgi:hypothetical protein
MDDSSLSEANHVAFTEEARLVLEQVAELGRALAAFRARLEEDDALSAAPTEEEEEVPVPGHMASPILFAYSSSAPSSPLWID